MIVTDLDGTLLRHDKTISEYTASVFYRCRKAVAFGDDYNDIEMLRDCGIGVAVANAIPEVKTAADYICDTNDNDGVAKWLEERVL